MSDLRFRRPNAKLEALFDQAESRDAEDFDDPIPAFVMPPYGLQGQYPDVELEEALADDAVDDMTTSPWGHLGPRMKYEPTP